MDLAPISNLLEMGYNQINGLPISLSHSGQFCDTHFRLSPEELSVNCLSISYQLCMEFFGNVVYQVNDAPIKDLGNSLSLK